MKDKFIWCLLILIIIGVIGAWFWIDYINKKDITNISDISEDSITTDKVSTTTSDDKDWSSYKTYNIELSSETVTITEEGVYNITGTLTDNNIVINTEGNVKLILNNVTIKNSNGPAINVENAKNVYIELVGENTIDATVTEELDAAIYSKDDLFILGDGSVTITSDRQGIKSSDDLVIESGNITIASGENAIHGNDSVTINGGKIKIESKDDGIHSKGIIEVNSGEIDVSGVEGIEATYVKINSGTINVGASDDGINATNKSTDYEVTVEINGGSITINMGQGDTDAIDSNGNLYINGGNITINAQSPFDYDGEAKYTAGTMIVNGTETTEITNQMMGGGQMGPGQGGQPNGQNRIK